MLLGKREAMGAVLLEEIDKPVSKQASRSAGNDIGENRIAWCCRQKSLHVGGIHCRLGARHECRAHLYAAGSEHQRGCDSAAIHDAACRNHRNRHGIDNLRHQRHRADLGLPGRRGKRSAMSARFAPLRNDGIDTRGCELACLFNCRRRRDDARAVGLERAHDCRVRSTEVAGEHGHPFLDHNCDLAIELAEQVDRIRDLARIAAPRVPEQEPSSVRPRARRRKHKARCDRDRG